jgi:hypothetical protein
MLQLYWVGYQLSQLPRGRLSFGKYLPGVQLLMHKLPITARMQCLHAYLPPGQSEVPPLWAQLRLLLSLHLQYLLGRIRYQIGLQCLRGRLLLEQQ